MTHEYSSGAIVINNQLSLNYENKGLTGAGIVYQFCRQLDKYYQVSYADDYIDLAALGIISDMGPVIEPENAYIISKGLETPWKNFFFQTLIDKQSYSIGDTLNSIAISFYITPLINALIRVGTMQEKENLFEAFIDGRRIVPSTKRGEKGQTEMLAVQVARNCTNARTHQNKALDEAIERIEFKIEDQELAKNQLLIVELDEDDVLPSTLNGLLAMKLVSKYKRPTLVVRENSQGIARGSLRGVSNSPFNDLRGYLEGTRLCEYAQGHSQAAGIGIARVRIPALVSRANRDLSQYDFGNSFYDVNFERKGSDPDIADLIVDIDKYQSIYGQGCPEPIIAIYDIHFSKNHIAIMGKNSDTLKIEYNGIAYMMFKAEKMIQEIQECPLDSITMTVIGRANLNHWGGRTIPQIFIDDYEIDDQLAF